METTKDCEQRVSYDTEEYMTPELMDKIVSESLTNLQIDKEIFREMIREVIKEKDNIESSLMALSIHLAHLTQMYENNFLN